MKKPNSSVIASIAALGIVGTLACINGVVKSFAGTPAPALVAPVSVVAATVVKPINPLGGEVYRGKGKTWGNKDSQVWLCADPKGGEWECLGMVGMTPAQARKDKDEAIARNNEHETNEETREEYGKNTYGNCGWTGCRGL